MTTAPLVLLADGAQIPSIGLGTYPMKDAAARTAVTQALESGYRLVDTASAYGNEEEVGRGIAEAGLARSDIYVTTRKKAGK